MTLLKRFINQPACGNFRNGYATLITVIVVGAVATSIAVSLLLISVNLSQTGLTYDKSGKAKALANAGAEAALEKIKEDGNYSGSVSDVPLGPGTYSYNVTKGASENRTVTVSGTAGSVIAKINIIIDDLSPKIHVVSWEEVGD